MLKRASLALTRFPQAYCRTSSGRTQVTRCIRTLAKIDWRWKAVKKSDANNQKLRSDLICQAGGLPKK